MLKNFNARRKLFICLFLILIPLVVFWQVSNNDFISFDDDDYVTNNPHIQTGITVKGVIWAFTETHAHNWHPLTWLSHMMDVQLFGLKPAGHHIMNLIFHMANTLLLFLILHRMTKALWQCAFVAALFALHPLHVESVAWAAERKDVLSAFFWMLTTGAYVYYVEQPDIRRYLLALLFFTLGLMSKPMLVTLPFVLLLLDYWPLARLQPIKSDVDIRGEAPQLESHTKKKQKSRKQNVKDTARINALSPKPAITLLIREKIPFFVIAVICSFVTLYAQHRIVKPMEIYPLGGRLANALISYAGYIGKMLWPLKLSIFYPYSHTAIISWQALGAAFFLLAMSLIVIWTSRRFPYLIAGWLWYLGTLVPVVGLVQVGLQSMADRYTYIPLIGIFIMIAWGVPQLLNRWYYRQAALAFVAAAVLCTLMAVTHQQVSYWRDSATLYKHAIEVTSDNNWAHYNLGLSLLDKGKLNDALPQFQEALRIAPNDSNTYLNIGVIYAKSGHYDKAVPFFSRALQLKPDSEKIHINLGNVFLTAGDIDRAFFHGQEAYRIKPDSPEVNFLLGKVFVRRGDFEKAITHYSLAIQLKPDYAEAHNNLGIVFARMEKLKEAVDHFHEALSIRPDYREAYMNLQVALSQQHKNPREQK